ncbi:NACHT and WD repeat domain-containing protein 2-like [Mantella aurantiaca]
MATSRIRHRAVLVGCEFRLFGCYWMCLMAQHGTVGSREVTGKAECCPKFGILLSQQNTMLLEKYEEEIPGSQLGDHGQRVQCLFPECRQLYSEWERAALRMDVYPKLREYCRHTYGLEFQVLDGYDGIHPDDLYSAKVRKIRQLLLEECIKSSAGPCFVALLGEEYGKPCLPTPIKADEFEKVMQTAEEHGVSTKILESRYRRDENEIPPVYNLLDGEEVSQYISSQRRDDLEVFQKIRGVFDIIIPLCMQKGILGEDQARRYFSSALEDELVFVLQHHPDLLEKCICYIHKVPFEAYRKQRGKAEVAEREFCDGYSRLCHLRDTVIPSLVHADGLQVFSTTTTCDIKVGYTIEKKQQYVDGLCRQFYRDMVKSIDSQIRRYQQPLKNGVEEISEHLSFCTMYSDLKQYEFREAEAIRNYILRDGSSKPMVVVGEPGCGKTVLLASCAKMVRLWLTDCDPIVVVRFVPAFGESLTLFRLLTGLCQQLSDIHMAQVPFHLDDIIKITGCFHSLLSMASMERPLVLIIDGIDNLAHCELNSDLFFWLPSFLPEFSKIILSVSQENILDQNKSQISSQVYSIKVQPMRRECNDNLKVNLLKEGRKITSGQQVYVNRSLTNCATPLQMHLVLKEVKGWKSHQDIDERSLAQSTHKLIERLFHKLETKYGYEFVLRALSYITLSRAGIGETELVDVLSADNMALAQLCHVYDNVASLRVPDWLVANILLDLKGCVASRMTMGRRLTQWTNTLYQQVVAKRYLNDQEIVRYLHESMCDYFSGRWAGGRAKSITIKSKPNSQSEKHKSKSITKTENKLYVDRRLPSQPWFFVVPSGTEQTLVGNLKKAFDLPYHLKECGKLDSLCNNVLMVLSYYKTLLRSGHLNTLIWSIEDAATQTGMEEVNLISKMLREARCLLMDSPNAFEVLVQSTLVPLLSVYPGLFRFTKQIICDSIKSSSMVIFNSALFKLPAIKVKFQESSQIVSILDANTKPELIVVFQNGHVYTWCKGKHRALEDKMSLSVEILSAALDSEDRYLALCTSKRSIMLLDYSSWTLLNEVVLYETVFTPKMYYLANVFLSVWYENTQQVTIFNILSGDNIEELYFDQKVDYFACIGEGQYLSVGQTNTLNLYSTKNGYQKITLQMETLKHSISDVYIHELCVIVIDKCGNIRIWNIDDPCRPHLMDELYSSEEQEEVRSTKYASKKILVCRSTTFEVWETSTWEKVSFKSLHPGKFIFCMFSQCGDEIIAAVENVHSLLVWSVKNGQLVSMINLDSQVSLLTKSLQLHLLGAVTKNNSLTLWDMKSVSIPTACSQTGRPLQAIILCPLGSRAYTSDGSDIVCKWSVPSCKLQAFFRHRDIVEMIRVSPNGEHLITSEPSGEIYIWETASGINTHCIHGSPISQMLITPNSSFVVTLCDVGRSRVWRTSTGIAVCKIRTFVRSALITPEGTFVIGVNNNRLLAISLWSGCVCKDFCCPDGTSSIVAFRCLTSHPDFIVLLTSNADLYTWNVVEETVCHQVKLSIKLPLPLPLFQISSNGDFIVITLRGTINVIHSLVRKHYTLHTPASILHQHLTKDGTYLVYICHERSSKCKCDFHSNPVLTVIEVHSGKTIAQCHLGKMPRAMVASDDDATVCVGFEDGTLGLYSVAGKWKSNARLKDFLSFSNKEGSTETECVQIYQSNPSADILWDDSGSSDLSLGSSSDEETVLVH